MSISSAAVTLTFWSRPSRRLRTLNLSPSSLLTYAKSPIGRKTVKYGAVSGIAIAVSAVALTVSYYAFNLKGNWAQAVAVIVSTPPSYVLNRRWVWRKAGRSDLRREVIPFWGIAVVQFVISVIVVGALQHEVEQKVASKEVRTLILVAISITVYGVMWVGKFILFNRVLFRHHDIPAAEAQPAR